jgi:multiple sugar transport system permease protein
MTPSEVAVPRRVRRIPFFVLLQKSVVYGVLLLGMAFTLVPFIWAILSSFKSLSELIRIPPTLLPEQWTLSSYQTIFTDPHLPLLRFYLNSLFVTGSRVFITLFTSSYAGFIFAKYKFWGCNAFFAILMATMMVPFQVIMIPSYLILVKLKLIDSLWGLILPALVDAFGIFMMRQFIESIPNELIDAARIDGASEFRIYLKIILPQMGAALATLGIFTFMYVWNDYLWPLVVITSTERRTLPLLLTWYNSQHASRIDLMMAASVLVLLPILIVYLFIQRWIVKGVALTGFK